MILATAGRRVDPSDAKESRFPLENVDIVRQRVRELLKAQVVTGVVSSAACGADLITLSEAVALGLRRTVVLPFGRERFRGTSVTDRPGDWGPLYDKILDAVEPVVIDDSYEAVNLAILDQAISQANHLGEPCGAALIWNGVSRGEDDITAHFGEEARKRGLAVTQIMTT